MKRTISFILGICIHLTVLAVTQVSIPDPDTWRYTDLKKYIGQTVQFDVPFYVCNNYNSITISPRRTYSPTNQALPLSAEYNSILSLNSQGSVTLTGVSGYHRLGERLHNLTVKVNSQTSVSLVSCDWRGNTRKELEKGVDLEAINMRGEHTLLVCCMNLEYYLVENLGSGSMGPKTREAHQKQRAKVSKALAKINADLYGFVEIELGQSALAELASDLTKNTGRQFAYIDDGSSAKGTYTKAGYVYCSEVLEPHGGLRYNDEGVDNRKKTQAFREKATGEVFLYSVNHFKAKVGSGAYGDNVDKGDGQGAFNGDRVREAKSVLNHYDSDSYYYGDKDILIMGDLNAYAMEDPITVLHEGGMIDLHRVFHADSSYSYVYHGQAGYLDHALCNETLYPHVTGIVAYHINSDESDSYAYDKSSDQSMFRSSDHDPVLVGLRLDTTYTAVPGVSVPDVSIGIHNFTPYIYNAEGGHYIVYRIDGIKVKEQSILSNQEEINGLDPGLYILNIYGQGKCHKMKIWFK